MSTKVQSNMNHRMFTIFVGRFLGIWKLAHFSQKGFSLLHFNGVNLSQQSPPLLFQVSQGLSYLMSSICQIDPQICIFSRFLELPRSDREPLFSCFLGLELRDDDNILDLKRCDTMYHSFSDFCTSTFKLFEILAHGQPWYLALDAENCYMFLKNIYSIQVY